MDTTSPIDVLQTVFFYAFVVVMSLAGLAIVWCLFTLLSGEDKLPEHEPGWEVVPAMDGGDHIGYQVRWSIPDDKGRFLWVGHYYSGPDTSLRWCETAAESHCKRLRAQKKLPMDFDTYLRVAQ